MELPQPFIRLPFEFDAERLELEAAALPAEAWMAHPSRMQGNSAVALVSRDGGDNDDFEGAMRTTRHLDRCPYTRQVMAGFGEVLGRSRFMKLDPGCEVAMHVDFNYHWVSRVRIHIPVKTDPAVIFQCADERIHMKAGECWIFNSWRRHQVVNESPNERIHLVIDTAGSSRFWHMVREFQNFVPHAPSDTFRNRVTRLEYDPQQSPDIETERYNTAPVMAPGEVDALVAELIGEFSSHPGNDPALVREYRDLLFDFSRDWRVTWLRFGYRPGGWPHYRRVIEAAERRLHPNARALVTGSNEIGVNPIIVQRLLRPALATERFDQVIGEAAAKE